MAEPAPMTEEQYLAAERRATEKHEFLNGVVRAMAGASWAHWTIVANLVPLLRAATRDKPCRSGGSDLRVGVENTRAYFYPDALVVWGEPKFRGDGAVDTLLNPSILFEVLSPSTAAYDRGDKFVHYEQIPTLQTYVLIESECPRIEVFQRLPDGAWRRTTGEGVDGEVDLGEPVGRLALSTVYAGLEWTAPTSVLRDR